MIWAIRNGRAGNAGVVMHFGVVWLWHPPPPYTKQHYTIPLNKSFYYNKDSVRYSRTGLSARIWSTNKDLHTSKDLHCKQGFGLSAMIWAISNGRAGNAGVVMHFGVVWLWHPHHLTQNLYCIIPLNKGFYSNQGSGV